MKLKLLIVDDNDFFRNGLKLMLARLDYVLQIDEAKNGVEFMEKLNVVHPDLVLMDIKMPGMDGIEATRNATHDNHDLKIIAFSMFSNENYMHKMIEAGAMGYILKDSGIDEIEKAIQSVMNNKHYYSEKMIEKLK